MAQKPDKLNAKSNDKPFPIHPEGPTFPARCVDVIDLGEAVITYPNSPSYLAQKAVLVFWTGKRDIASGQVTNVHMEFTLSMGKKANLRAFLESWRGKSYTDDQAKEGVPVDKLYGAPALIAVEHKEAKSSDRKYARVRSVSPLPEEMKGSLPKVEDIEYTRDEWWTKKREAIATETKKFREAIGAPTEDNFEEFPAAQEGDDDLPF